MTPIFYVEFANQCTDDIEDGVVVKLYDKTMSDLTKRYEDDIHSKRYHRIWMEGEYEVLTKAELKKLIKGYDERR